MNFDDLIAKPGEPVLPKYNALIRWLGGLINARAGNGVRSRQNDLGTTYIADVRSAAFVPKWKVRRQGDNLTVGLGTLNGLVPVIDGKSLDQTTPPSISIKGMSGNAQGRSWVALVVTCDEKGVIPEDDPEAMRIEHVTTLANSATRRVQPLALLLWDKASLKALHQVAMHDLNFDSSSKQFFAV